MKLWNRSCIAFIGASAFITPFIFSTQTGDPTIVPRFIFLSLVLLVITSLLSFKSGQMFSDILREPIVVVYIGFLLISIFSWLLTDLKAEGYFELARIFLKVQLLIVSVALFTRCSSSMSWLAQAFTVTALIVGVIGIAQYHGWGFVFIPGLKVPYATMQHRNLFASFMFLTMPFTLLNLWESLNSRSEATNNKMTILNYRFVFSVITLGITLYCLAIAQSRAVWLAIGIAILAIGMMEITSLRSRTLSKPIKILIKSVLIFFGSSLILLAVFIIATRYKIVYSDNDRIFLWTKTLAMIKDHPLVGVGPGNWKLHLPFYGLEELHVYYSEGLNMFRRAGNDFLQVVAETGILGFTLFVSIYVVVIKYLFKIKKQITDSRDYVINICLLFGIIGFLAISFFSFPHERMEHSVLITILMACVIVQNRKYFPISEKSKSIRYHPVWNFASILILTCCVWLGMSLFGSGIHARRALTIHANQDWKGVIEEMDKASTPFYRLELTGTPLAWYSGVAYFALEDHRSALREFLEAYRYHPNHMHVLNNLASSYAKLHSLDKAEEFYNKALHISPNYRESLVNLGVIYYNQSEYKKAHKLFDKAYVLGGFPNLTTYLQKVRKKLIQLGIDPVLDLEE